MLNFLKRLVGFIDTINERVGRAVSWLTTALVLLIFVDVVMRYLFNFSSAGVFEMEWHLFAVIFLLGAGYTLKHDRHVRVDVFYTRFNEKQKAWVNLLGTLILLIPLCWVVIVTSTKFVSNSYFINESSVDPGGLPSRFIIKSMITIGFALLFLQAISLVARSLLIINDHSSES